MPVRTDLPAHFEGLELYGDLPVPATVMVVDGRPDFRQVDVMAQAACLANRLCAICGKPLDYWLVFVGGPQSIDSRLFLDGPMHEDCTRWAVANCPFLVGKRTSYSGRAPSVPEGGEVRTSEAMTERPERMAMAFTRRYQTIANNGRLFIKAAPFKKVEWFDG